MKKRLFLFVLAVLVIPGILWAAELNNVTARGVDGNLVFYDASGNEIFTMDASNRKLSIPSGSAIELASGGYVSGFSQKIASIVMTGVDYTLSATEALCNILVVTGSPSSKAIIAPTISASGVARLYTVRNAGSDSGQVTIKKSGGTGVDIATGKTAEVYWGGSDYLRKTADATH